jgi:hypothetical protein
MTVPPSHGWEHATEDEVLQHDEDDAIPRLAPVAVVVEGMVNTRDVGTVDWAGHTYSVGAVNTTQICFAHPMRSRIVLEVITQDLWIGRTEAEARAKTGFKINASAGKTVELRHREDMYALADSGTAVVSVYEEYWTG